MELVATESFDLEDEDWACDEVTDFSSRDNPFCLEEKANLMLSSTAGIPFT